MAQPPRYERVKNFGEDYGDETDNAAIDSELDGVSQSINGLRDNLAIIQRDDGGLKDGIVTSSSIEKGVLDDITETVAADVNDQVLAAEQYSVNAYNSAISAQGSVIAAQGQAIIASQKATDSENFAFLASQWANKPYSPVEGGDYSAKYWADRSASYSGIVPATELLPGISRFGTAQEVAAGLLSNVAVSPANLKPRLDEKASLNSPAFTGTVTGITKDMVGLDKADNTADLDKPISAATQEVFDALGAPAVGLVEQVGGTPTGAIVERGSNANGEYVRWADGTQMCFKYVSLNVNLVEVGAIYGALIPSQPYPAPFAPTTVPIVSMSCDSSLHWGSVDQSGIEWLTPRVFTPISGRTVTAVRLFAFGRWF